MLITKKFYFDAAHRLHRVRTGHPCRNLHGHRYEVEIAIKNDEDLPLIGTMLIDYHDLGVIKNYLNNVFDHATLVSHKDKELVLLTSSLDDLASGTSEIREATLAVFGKRALLEVEETTAECLSIFLKKVFQRLLKDNLPKGARIAVNVSETPNTSARTRF